MLRDNRARRVHPETIVLDIGGDVGALVIYTEANLVHTEIEVSRSGKMWPRTHTEVLERRVGGRPVFAAVFAALTAGHYQVWAPDPSLPATVSIVGGEIAELDWRRAMASPLAE